MKTIFRIITGLHLQICQQYSPTVVEGLVHVS